MAKKEKKQKKIYYLTKAITERASKKGFIEASKNAMAEMGYVVVAQGEWVVKKFPDGTSVRISPIKQINVPNGILFD